MYPTLKIGEYVLTQNWFFKIKLDDLVVARVKNRLVIKRVKKLSGRNIFIEGDNKRASTDSRDFGEITHDQLIGKVILSGF